MERINSLYGEHSIEAHSYFSENEEVSRMKEQFLMLVSHQLNGLIQPLMTSVELIQLGEHKGRDKVLVEILSNSVRRMEQFARAVINANIWTSGLGHSHLMRVNMEALVNDIIDELDKEKPMRGRIFLIDITGPEKQLTDVYILRYAIEGIIRNALEYTSRSKRIWIRSHWVENRYSLIIEDDGQGYPFEVLRAFPALFTTTELIPKGHQGLGLHLSAVRIMINAIGGDFHIGVSDKGGALTQILLPELTRDAGPEWIQK